MFSTPNGATSRVETTISIDLSAGVTDCASDTECVICNTGFNGKECDCPQGQALQPDNSCTRRRIWGGKWKKNKKTPVPKTHTKPAMKAPVKKQSSKKPKWKKNGRK